MKVSFNGLSMDVSSSQFTEDGWLPGWGVFETLRTVNGIAYSFSRHMERALLGCRALSVPIPEYFLVREAITDLISLNSFSDGVLRISFGSDGQWGAVHMPYRPVETPAKVRIHPVNIATASGVIKSYPYTHRLEILNQAKSLGFDEALVCNSDGNIAEGAVTNLLLQLDGRWLTPPIEDGVLPGIMRDLVLENLEVDIESIPLSKVEDITSALLLSSLRFCQPVASINGRALQSSGPLSAQIHALAALHSID